VTAKKNVSNAEMLKGTLDMMILRTLVTGDAHGHTIAKVIERTSEDIGSRTAAGYPRTGA
jgi:PadR family transcriptional regulator PadR